MMAEAKIVFEGYTSIDANGRSCSTVTLVRDEEIAMIIDPGTLPDQKVLIDALKNEGLSIDDINIVGLTHSHMDHFRNIGMFPKAKVIDYWGWWINDFWKKSDGNISENISIIKTPGHTKDSITFLVKTERGKVAICGDVLWKNDLLHKDPFAEDLKELDKSRKKVLEIADYIIPGHGKMFKT